MRQSEANCIGDLQILEIAKYVLAGPFQFNKEPLN